MGNTVLERFHEVVICLLRVSLLLIFILVTAVNEEQLEHRMALTLGGGFLEVLDGLFDILRYSKAVMIEHADMVHSNNIALLGTLIVKLSCLRRLLLPFSPQFLVRVSSGCTSLCVTKLTHHIKSLARLG